MSERQIVAFGGLRATPGRVHPIVDYVLDLTGKPRARVAIIPTATGDAPDRLQALYDRLPADRAERSHLALFNRSIADLRGYLLSQDVIWVGGGNTVNMLAIWRAHGVDLALREAWEAGVVLAGGSAGSLCWFEGGTTDSFNLFELAPIRDGLRFLAGTHCPHYDGEAQRRPLYHRLISEGLPGGIAVDEDAAAHFVGTELKHVVSSRTGAGAYRVEPGPEGAVETPLPHSLLPAGRLLPWTCVPGVTHQNDAFTA
ncbi:MAG: peptidase dipeptidase [Armatimonadetes bacterium]|jgi:peptidase E|nr:peptidase dipeptidase [Armatimonadota bacterium]